MFNLLRVRDPFEIPVQAIDSLSRKMHIAKSISKSLQQFQEFLDLPKAHPWVWGLESRCLPIPQLPVLYCLGYVCSICARLTLVNQGERPLLVLTTAFSFACAKYKVGHSVRGSQGTREVRKKIYVEIR